jgi:ATP-dependent exoDNAse (exonuclease V) beta subunit
MPSLAAGVTRRERTTPSGAKKKTAATATHSASGMKFGSEVHVAFEQVGWVDEATPDLPASDAGRLVADLLKVPVLRKLFERGGQSVELFREQAVDAVLDGKWLSGVIDRLHLHRDASGVVNRVQVVDFKTDGLDDIKELVERYSGQMQAYREVMERAYPAARVECVLLSTRCREHVSI